jgi:hypothetical protein
MSCGFFAFSGILYHCWSLMEWRRCFERLYMETMFCLRYANPWAQRVSFKNPYTSRLSSSVFPRLLAVSRVSRAAILLALLQTKDHQPGC